MILKALGYPLLITLAGLLAATPSVASNRQSLSLSIGSKALDWREFNDRLPLNIEDGNLTSGKIDYTTYVSNGIFISARYEGAEGTVDYDGLTTGGTSFAVVSETDHSVSDVSLRLGYHNKNTYLQPRTYLGIGFYDRNRLIKDTTGINTNDVEVDVLGLDETYKWSYFIFGLKTDLLNKGKFKIQVNAEMHKLQSPEVGVISEAFGTGTFKLGDAEQNFAEIAFFYQLSRGFEVGLSHSFLRTNISDGRETNFTTINGAEGVIAKQPETRKKEIHTSINLGFSF